MKSFKMKKDTRKFVDALSHGAEQLDRLNKAYPNLADDFTRDTVEEFRRKPIQLEQGFSEEKTYSTINMNESAESEVPGSNENDQKLTSTAQELLAIHSFEDALDIMQTKHDTPLNMLQLIELAGQEAYIGALKREVQEFQSNAISVDQVAQLWKDFGRPPIDGSSWTARSVSMLLE